MIVSILKQDLSSLDYYSFIEIPPRLYSFTKIIIKQCHSEYALCFVAWLYSTHYDSVSNFSCSSFRFSYK